MLNELKGVKRNFIYNMAYQLLTIITPLIITPYISRVLHAKGVGTYAFAYAVANYFVIFTLLGLNNYGNKTIAKSRKNIVELSTVFWEIRKMQVVTSFVSSACYIAYVVFVAENDIVAWVMLIYVLSSGLDINWCFFGLEQFKEIFIRNSLIKIGTTVAILLFVKNENDIVLYTLIMACSFFASQSIMWIFVRKHIKYIHTPFASVKKHIRPNLVLFIPSIAVSVYRIMDKLMLGIMGNETEVGFYESSEVMTSIPLMLITAIGTVMLPRMANLVENTDKERIFEITTDFSLLSVFITAPMVAGMMAVSNVLVPFFYGAGYEKCITLFYVILPSTLFIGLANVIRTQLLIPYGRNNVYVKSYIIGAVINMCFNLILIKSFQSVGAAIATLATEIVVWAVQAKYTQNEICYKRILPSVNGLIIISAVMGLVVYLIPIPIESKLLILVCKVVLGIMLYLIMLFSYIKINKDKNIRRLIDVIIRKN